MKSVKDLEKLLRDFAAPRGYDLDKVFTGLLDYVIGYLDPMGRPVDYWPFKAGENVAFHEMMCCLCEVVSMKIEHEGWYDIFGDLFMSLHQSGNGKGQFFTPPSLCNLMARVNVVTSEPKTFPLTPFGRRISISDCACGSSRLLLAGAYYQTKAMRENWGYSEVEAYRERPYLCAEDIDFNCCKMSAINICLHGYYGEVVCHDTLASPTEVCLGYIINETDHPFPTGIPSIRKELDPNKFLCTRIWKDKAAEQRKPEPKEKARPKGQTQLSFMWE